MQAMQDQRKGFLFAFTAYTAWGVFPAFWRLFLGIPHLSVLAHRIFWSAVFFLGLLAWREKRSLGSRLRATRPYLATILLASVLVSANWFTYIHAVNTGHVLESSLGYFITPLVNVLLGMIFLKERLRPLQWISVILAAIGVTQLALQGDRVPYIALILASTFGLYGLVRKTLKVDALTASTVEVLILVVPVMIYILGFEEPLPFAHPWVHVFLILSGPVTGLPLLWFVEAARRLPLSTMGFFQYIAPSLQFSLAVFAYGEAFTQVHARSFACIWTALALFSFDLLSRAYKRQKANTLGNSYSVKS